MYQSRKYTNEQIDQAHEMLKKATKEHPVKSKELEGLLQAEDADGHPASRGLIKVVMEKKGLPLAADGGGYYIISSLDELKQYHNSLQKRINGIMDRQVMVRAAFISLHPELLPDADIHDEDIDFDDEEDL